jgi:thiol-disulfide isomerase/thioredoxin
VRRSPLLALLAVALGCGAAGFLVYRLLTPRPTITVVSAAAPPATAEAAPARPVPQSLPALTLPDLAGHNRSLADFRGHPLIVNFWASWCEPCRREIPLLQELRRRYAADGLEVLGIAIDFKPAVTDFLRTTPIHYPILLGEQRGLEAVEQFGMQPVLPFSVFADRRGRIVALKIGELHKDEADTILAALREVDAGRSSLPAAREAIADQLKQLAAARARQGTG